MSNPKFVSSSQCRSRCRVGRGWVVASQSQQEQAQAETMSKRWTHRDFYQTHACSRTHCSSSHQPNSHSTEENTHKHSTVLLYPSSVRAGDVVRTPISLSMWPCVDPVLNSHALQTPVQAYVWCVRLCVLSVCRVNLLRSSGPALL